MSENKLPDNVNPERREFLEKLTKGAFIVPAVFSVMMLNQKLNLSTANAVSTNQPACLPCDAMISTPNGDVRVIDLRPGMPVFTLDINGNKVVDTIELVSKVTVPAVSYIYRLILDDGRELLVSGGHPAADGRLVKNLAAGDILDGAELVSIEKVRYEAGYTYDLLPGGETGHYWAGGVLIGSTLSPKAGFYMFKSAQTMFKSAQTQTQDRRV